MDPTLLAPWRLGTLVEVAPPPRGTNNDVRLVRTSDGRRYVVRTYQNLTLERVQREHALLRVLRDDPRLDLAVPRPMPLPDGRTVAPGERGPVAVLEFLEGTTPERTTAMVRAAGDAAGRLARVLAAAPKALAPVDWRIQRLDTLRPEVPDLGDLVAELRRVLPDHPGTGWLAEHVTSVDAEIAQLAADLPTQVVHGDLALSNLLARDDRITAVLDWEIAGWDLRVSEVVSGLMNIAGDPEDPRWPARVAAFYEGYEHHVRLSAPERTAVPALVRYGALASTVWRAARWRQGSSTLDEVADRLADGVVLDRHLAGYAGQR